jgi:hypothetical protein
MNDQDQYLSAIEWRRRLDNVLRELRNSQYNSDLYKLYSNIDSMITELSKMEVYDRQYKTKDRIIAQSNKIKQSIDYLEKMILILKLTY